MGSLKKAFDKAGKDIKKGANSAADKVKGNTAAGRLVEYLEKSAKQFGKGAKDLGDKLSGKDKKVAAKKAADVVAAASEEEVERIESVLGISLKSIADGVFDSLDALEEGTNIAQEFSRLGMLSAEEELALARDGSLESMYEGFDQAENALTQSVSEQRDILNQAGGMFDPVSSLAGDALGRLGESGTAAGRASQISGILSDPNQQAAIQQIQELTGDQLSGAGLRRSGAGAQMSNENLLNFASGQADIENQRQQQLAGMGIGGIQAQSDLLGRQASAVGSGGQSLANLLSGAGMAASGIQQQFGRDIANVLQQGAGNQANMANLLGMNKANTIESGVRNIVNQQVAASGQAGQAMGDKASAEAGAIIGGQQADQQAVNNAMTLIAAMMSDERLKANIEKVGSHDGINVYTWEWNDSAGNLGLYGASTGHIAQELMETHPHLVRMDDESGYYYVDYSTDETVERDLEWPLV